MGVGNSHVTYDSVFLQLYERASNSSCMLPDVGIDESMLKYSGMDSNAALQAYSNNLVASVPGYINHLGRAMGALQSVPNAVGLGALVISMIMEISMKSIQGGTDSYSLLQRVFGEEKASAVRDTMSDYVRRHRLFINNDQRLMEEIQRLEQQLNGHLTILKNSLLHDGQMSTRGFKIWVNGAFFHLQMLIHEARLKVESGDAASAYVDTIDTAATLYLQDLDHLLPLFKSYKFRTTYLHQSVGCYFTHCAVGPCDLGNTETNCHVSVTSQFCPYTWHSDYNNRVFSQHKPIIDLKSSFLNVKSNLLSLINQHDSFTLPSAA